MENNQKENFKNSFALAMHFSIGKIFEKTRLVICMYVIDILHCVVIFKGK